MPRKDQQEWAGMALVRWLRRSLAFGAVLLAGCAAAPPPQLGEAPPAASPPGLLLAAAGASPLVPDGYVADMVAADLPGAADVQGDASGLYVLAADGLWYLRPGGRTRVIANPGPGRWTAMALKGGRLVIAEDRQDAPSRLLRLDAGPTLVSLFEAAKSGANAFTSPAWGPDGSLYVAQGTATNPGVGTARDRPCQDLRLTDGRRLRGTVPCHGAVLRLPPGGVPQVVAWGLRAPSGLAVRAVGSLFVAERSFEAEPARGLAQPAPDLFRRVAPGIWYGWPDHAGTAPLGMEPLLAAEPNPPPPPLATLPAEAEPGLFDVADQGVFGGEGEAFVPMAGEGRVARINPASGQVVDFALGFARPVAARFSLDGRALYVVDQERGSIWRIRRQLEIAEAPPEIR